MGALSEREILAKIQALLTAGITATIAAGDLEIGAVELKNGTDDTRGTVKAASTAAVAGDTSLVVSLSPNNSAITKGDVADNAAQVNLSPNYVGGKAVTTSSYAPSYTAADSAGFAVDKDNGGVLVNQANLALAEDTVHSVIGSTATATGALTHFRSLTVSSTAEAVKASAGNLYKWRILNLTAGTIYVKIYNIAAASVNPAVDVPIITLPLGGTSSVVESMVNPSRFGTAISIRCVTGVGDTNTTSPATSPIIELEYA